MSKPVGYIRTAAIWVMSAILLASAATTTALAKPFPYNPAHGEVWEYDLLFRDNAVGEMVLRFEYDEQDRLHVISKSEGRIKVAFITVFRMESAGQEVWRGNQIEMMEFVGDMNGENQWGRLTRQEDGRLLSEGPNGSQTVSGDLNPIASWTPLTSTRTKFVRPLENDVIEFTIKRAGWETIDVDGEKAEAFKFVPPADAEGNQTYMWYDRKGRWARMDMITANGTLSFVRRAAHLGDGRN